MTGNVCFPVRTKATSGETSASLRSLRSRSQTEATAAEHSQETRKLQVARGTADYCLTPGVGAGFTTKQRAQMAMRSRAKRDVAARNAAGAFAVPLRPVPNTT